tara:strand:- start:1586 stop:2497 length:912 start_codon:yes stop_codon:yes gene_type:complete
VTFDLRFGLKENMRTLGFCFFTLVLYLCGNMSTRAANSIGPYRELSRDLEVVEDVFANRGRIYMVLSDESREKEMIVKISDARNSQFLKWPEGKEDRIVSGERETTSVVKDAGWIETKAPFIEYWMEDKLVLHLMRVRDVSTRPFPLQGLAVLVDLTSGQRSRTNLSNEGKIKETVGEQLEPDVQSKNGIAKTVEIENEPPRFGPYCALVMDRTVIRDVKVDEDMNTCIKLDPKFRKDEIRVKISNFNKAGYREWDYKGFELVSPAEAGRPQGAWTDWIKVDAKFVEYWMESSLILHLMRTDL